MFFSHIDAIDDEDVFDDEAINDENNDEEHFQVQPTEDKSNFILVNTRIDYQYRSDKLNNTCLYDFVSTFYKKKINETDLRYLSNLLQHKNDKIIKEIDHLMNDFLFKTNILNQQHIY